MLILKELFGKKVFFELDRKHYRRRMQNFLINTVFYPEDDEKIKLGFKGETWTFSGRVMKI